MPSTGSQIRDSKRNKQYINNKNHRKKTKSAVQDPTVILRGSQQGIVSTLITILFKDQQII